MGGQPQAGAAKSDSALTVESLEPRLAGAEACLPQGRQLLDGEPPVADASTWRPPCTFAGPYVAMQVLASRHARLQIGSNTRALSSPSRGQLSPDRYPATVVTPSLQGQTEVAL